jgi:DNA-binding SARP family transcriptional activator
MVVVGPSTGWTLRPETWSSLGTRWEVVGSAGVALEFRILGPLEVLEDGRPIALGGPRQRGVVVVLLTHLGELVPASRLIDEIWADEPPAAASNVLQGYVSVLRKALGRGRIETRGNGYRLVLGQDDVVDIRRFEELVAEAEGAAPVEAAALLREALSLWRGPSLADVAEEPYALPAAARLDELRLYALEQRLEAELAAGCHEQLVGELRALVREHPYRERLRRQLMLALYRAGRQAEALDAYRDARSALVGGLGIDPSPALQELERAILRQDPALEATASSPHRRAILVVPENEAQLGSLLALAEPLARRSTHDLIVASVVARAELTKEVEFLTRQREALGSRGIEVRMAAFTSDRPGRDLARLANEQDVDMVLLAGRVDIAPELLLEHAPCDVAVLLDREGVDAPRLGPDRPVLVPFGGTDHDWAAVEIAAWLAQALNAPLRIAGVSRGSEGGDASRLLASVSLIVQRFARVVTSPVLVDSSEEGLLDATEGVGLIVFGLSTDWRKKGLGRAREAVARHAAAPTLLVHKGTRPSGLAPEGTRTRFTWSLGAPAKSGTPQS